MERIKSNDMTTTEQQRESLTVIVPVVYSPSRLVSVSMCSMLEVRAHHGRVQAQETATGNLAVATGPSSRRFHSFTHSLGFFFGRDGSVERKHPGPRACTRPQQLGC